MARMLSRKTHIEQDSRERVGVMVTLARAIILAILFRRLNDWKNRESSDCYGSVMTHSENV